MKNLLDTLPSTLPPGYIAATLRRLLPDPQTVAPEKLPDWMRLKDRFTGRDSE